MDGTQATVFGLQVRADRRIAFLEGAPARAAGRPLELHVQRGHPGELDWPRCAGVICTRREVDGSESFRIESDPAAGYLIWGRGRGSYVLSGDGLRLRCAPDATPPGRWERFLIGQVLPFAALVRGLEIFHASAVALDGAAIAFAGPSGAGKTSVALSLCDAGAGFLADDVLALEPRDGALLAHPGTPAAGIDRRESRRRRDVGRPSGHELLTSDRRERVVRIRTSADAAPLDALFFLDRRRDGPCEPSFEPVTDPLTLLAATFNFVLATRERLRGLLDVCALTAQRRVERIHVGPAVEACQLGAAVQQRLEEES